MQDSKAVKESSPLLQQGQSGGYGGLYEQGPAAAIPPPPYEQKRPSVDTNGSSKYTPSGTHRNLFTQTTVHHHSFNPDGSDSDDHCHTNDPFQQGDPHARRTLWMASALIFCFMIGEIVGGFIAGSLAIMTDAAHLLTDIASFMISLFALYLSARPATRKMSFGWHRAEVLGALMSVLLIWLVTGILVYMAVMRLISMDYTIDAKVMVITASVGVCVNIIMGLMLHFSGGHGHSHGGSTDTPVKTRTPSPEEGQDPKSTGPKVKRRNINVRAAFVHVIGDFFQSLGVFTAAMIIYFKPNLIILDPICTFLFSILVLITTMTVIRDALNVLMEGKPKGIEFDHVAESLLLFDGVSRIHNLRIWSLTMDKVAVSAHLAVEASTDPQVILKKASDYLKQEYNVYECTLQIERFSNDMNECEKCDFPNK